MADIPSTTSTVVNDTFNIFTAAAGKRVVLLVCATGDTLPAGSTTVYDKTVPTGKTLNGGGCLSGSLT